MRAPRYFRKSRIQIGFLSKSAKFPIHFSGGNLLEKVFHKIHSIEEARELQLSKNSSNEDLNKLSAQAATVDSQENSTAASNNAAV